LKRWFPWIAGGVIVAGLVWAFIYLKDVHPLGALGTKLQPDRLSDVAIRFKGAKLVGRSEGRKVWTFEAKTIDLSKDRRLATFKGITQGTLLEDGKRLASLSAGKVIYNTLTRDVSVPGTAEFALVDGPSFTLRGTYWNGRSSRLFSRGGVDARLDGSTFHGERMTADLDRKVLEVQKVSGRIRIE
jgi:hypothetical protein